MKFNMKDKKIIKDEEINQDVKDTVIARIEAQTPSNLRLFIGSSQGMNKEEIINHVKSEDEIGRLIIKSHLSFMKALISGEVTKAITSI